MPRRSNGEGSIRQRSDGRWIGQISIAGKRRSVYGKARKDVVDQLGRIRADALIGLTTAPSARTVGEYLPDWRGRAEHLRPSTAYLYDLLIRVHVVPSLGTVRLKDLAPLHLNECYRRIKGARTREQVHRLLNKALGDAVRLRLIPHNPAAMLDVPSAKPKKKRRWTLDEVRAFVAGCSRYETLYDALWLFMLGSSCRIGEALALQESDVDWETGTVGVRQGVVRIGTRRELADPKTEAGIRKISLPPFAVLALRSRLPYLVDGYFFRTRTGTVPWTSDLQKRLKEACFRAAVPMATSHDLRRMHASLAIVNGVDVKTVQSHLGHKTLAMTLGLYAEAMASGDIKAARVLEDVLNPGTGTGHDRSHDASPTPDGGVDPSGADATRSRRRRPGG